MVFSGAVDRIIGRPPPTTGDAVLVSDATEKPIAEKLLQSRIAEAVELRKRLGLPSRLTNAYRLVNGEGDRPSLEILKKEGLDVATIKPDIQPSSCPETTQVVENGISYAISLAGQKTGFYADQRESRHFISTISQGQKVADICCYSGGFALNAARGGAIDVTDAAQFMKGAIARNESWDIVILDPPKLAPSRKVCILSTEGSYLFPQLLAKKIVRLQLR
ncbi:unnamed protein product [Linum tenue]|uniref:S-adenosylmethionine-dependent methyltransferase domain-containing protein n=1 Tax=Linum tenue TaxID=586396 RepID=A0AAV0QSQ8_9ROSI|nr:unnamed protein product [Linum tenue]